MSFAVNLTALTETSNAIADALAVLNEEGINGEAESGQPIQDWTLSEKAMGHEGAAEGLEELLLRARYEARQLFAGTNDLIDGLKDTRSAYEKASDAAVKEFTSLMDTLFAAPKTPQQESR